MSASCNDEAPWQDDADDEHWYATHAAGLEVAAALVMGKAKEAFVEDDNDMAKYLRSIAQEITQLVTADREAADQARHRKMKKQMAYLQPKVQP